VCEQLAQGCYLAVLQARVDPGTFRSPVWLVTVALPSHTRLCWTMLEISSLHSALSRDLCLLRMHWQPVLPTPEEAYNFCLQVWESDSEENQKKVKEKRAAASESPEAAAADSTEPAEPAEV